MTVDRADDGGCVVIDMQTRRPRTNPSTAGVPESVVGDYELRQFIFTQFLPILEAGVPRFSPGSKDGRDFQCMLSACRRGLGDFSEFRGLGKNPPHDHLD